MCRQGLRRHYEKGTVRLSYRWAVMWSGTAFQHQSEGAFYFYGKDFPKTLRSIVKGFNFEIEVPETPRYVEIVVWDGYTQVLI